MISPAPLMSPPRPRPQVAPSLLPLFAMTWRAWKSSGARALPTLGRQPISAWSSGEGRGEKGRSQGRFLFSNPAHDAISCFLSHGFLFLLHPAPCLSLTVSPAPNSASSLPVFSVPFVPLSVMSLVSFSSLPVPGLLLTPRPSLAVPFPQFPSLRSRDVTSGFLFPHVPAPACPILSGPFLNTRTSPARPVHFPWL